MTRKSIEYYMGLPYKVEVYPDEEGKGYAALIPDLPGCMTSADSLAELWPMIEDAKRLWLEVALEDGIPINEPKPVEVEQFSGKFVLRLAKTLHRQLSHRAEAEGVSLNSLVVTLINQSMGSWYARYDQFKAYDEVYPLPGKIFPIPWDDYVIQKTNQPVVEPKPAGWTLEKAPMRPIMEGKGKYAC
ncbi:MAG: type II toxin-antitoxin system HicB family antitoxin [Anaerolineales bacterium]